MENTLENEKIRKFSDTRTILVSPKNHKFLTLMKIENGFKNIDECMDILIESFNKLRVIEIANKQKKESKNGKIK